MKVDGVPYRSIWLDEDRTTVRVIDQRALPFAFEVRDLRTVDECATAIRDMWVRGAGLIGATAGYGMLLAALSAAEAPPARRRDVIARAAADLRGTRPTAVNLAWAVDRQRLALEPHLDAAAAETDPAGERLIAAARDEAERIADEDAAACRSIGEHGVGLLTDLAARSPGQTVNVLTHCNAGWLAFVDHGSATAPIYAAHDAGVPVHVWVDETRPRSQGARLTAWELARHGVPHTVIADNAGGHLMQRGLVDIVITGSDRTARNGDVANKIGTYEKALAARDNGVPFYVALPSSTFDLSLDDGVRGIPIEERDAREITHAVALHEGRPTEVALMDEATPAKNYAFDVTPARLVTGLITERGICEASANGIVALFPDLDGAS